MTAAETRAPGQPVTTLRGAGVAADSHRVGRAVVAVCLGAVAVLVAVLFLAGVERNAQITRLRQHGVAVKVTVSGCLGLMGGSGSNLVGYQCRGTFTAGGHRYSESIPGDTFYAPGTTLRAVAVPGDPALLSTVRALADQRPSSRVFVLPASLLGVLVLLVGALVLRGRRVRRA